MMMRWMLPLCVLVLMGCSSGEQPATGDWQPSKAAGTRTDPETDRAACAGTINAAGSKVEQWRLLLDCMDTKGWKRRPGAPLPPELLAELWTREGDPGKPGDLTADARECTRPAVEGEGAFTGFLKSAKCMKTKGWNPNAEAWKVLTAK